MYFKHPEDLMEARKVTGIAPFPWELSSISVKPIWQSLFYSKFFVLELFILCSANIY
jgi:hypothetical protein